MNHAQANHLRRLLGWVRCQIGQSPEEHIALINGLRAKGLDFSSPAGQSRVVEHHARLERVPKYIRAAVKSLEPLVGREDIGEAEIVQRKIAP